MHLLFIFYFLCVCVFLCGVCMGHDMPRLRPCESFEAGSPGPQHKVSMVYASAIPVKARLGGQLLHRSSGPGMCQESAKHLSI